MTAARDERLRLMRAQVEATQAHLTQIDSQIAELRGLLLSQGVEPTQLDLFASISIQQALLQAQVQNQLRTLHAFEDAEPSE